MLSESYRPECDVATLATYTVALRELSSPCFAFWLGKNSEGAAARSQRTPHLAGFLSISLLPSVRCFYLRGSRPDACRAMRLRHVRDPVRFARSGIEDRVSRALIAHFLKTYFYVLSFVYNILSFLKFFRINIYFEYFI